MQAFEQVGSNPTAFPGGQYLMRATVIQVNGYIEACQTDSVSCHPERLTSFVFGVRDEQGTRLYAAVH
jgi:uncharacterized Zn-binding protein involved in type VI secretion